MWNGAARRAQHMRRLHACRTGDRGREAVLRRHARLEFRGCHSLAVAALVKRRRANADISEITTTYTSTHEVAIGKPSP